MRALHRPNATWMNSLLALLVLPATQIEGSASYTVTIQPGTDECFFIRMPPDQKSIISGNFDLLNDAAAGKIFTAYLQDADTSKNIWESPKGVKEGVFSVPVEPDVKHVEFCLDLEKQVDDDEVEDEGLPVGFNIYVATASGRTLPEGENGPDAKRALELVAQAEEISLNWRTLLDHFDFLRNREAQHALMSSQILSRVMTWTIVEAVLVITMAIGQVLYWRKFFEQRRYL